RKHVEGEHCRRADYGRARAVDAEARQAAYGEDEVGREKDYGRGQVLSEQDLGDHQVGHLLVPALRDAVEGEAEALRFAGMQVAHLTAGDGHALPKDYLAVVIAEHAVDLDQLHISIAVVPDLAGDL